MATDARVLKSTLLWGVEFRAKPRAPAVLLGSLWAMATRSATYPGEPTRALLFTTRAHARAWCAQTMCKWRSEKQRDSSVARWVVRAVRVRETVEVAELFEQRKD